MYLQTFGYANARIVSSTIAGESSELIAAADAGAQFVAPDWLLFLRQGTRMTQHLDLAPGELSGQPVSVADQLVVSSALQVGAYSVSARP